MSLVLALDTWCVQRISPAYILDTSNGYASIITTDTYIHISLIYPSGLRSQTSRNYFTLTYGSPKYTVFSVILKCCSLKGFQSESVRIVDNSGVLSTRSRPHRDDLASSARVRAFFIFVYGMFVHGVVKIQFRNRVQPPEAVPHDR